MKLLRSQSLNSMQYFTLLVSQVPQYGKYVRKYSYDLINSTPYINSWPNKINSISTLNIFFIFFGYMEA